MHAKGVGSFMGGNKGGVWIAARTTTAAVIGGTASVLSGGKFANGAVTSAFQHLFNSEATRTERVYIVGATPSADQIDRANQNENERLVGNLVEKLLKDGVIKSADQIRFQVAQNEDRMLSILRMAESEKALIFVILHGSIAEDKVRAWDYLDTPDRWRARFNALITEWDYKNFDYADSYTVRFYGCNPIDGRSLPEKVFRDRVEPAIRRVFN